MKRLTAKFHIALGQTGLLASLLLVAIYLGLVPDRLGAIREGRAALAEAIAANSSAFISQADIRRLEATLRLVVDRNDMTHNKPLSHKFYFLDSAREMTE